MEALGSTASSTSPWRRGSEPLTSRYSEKTSLMSSRALMTSTRPRPSDRGDRGTRTGCPQRTVHHQCQGIGPRTTVGAGPVACWDFTSERVSVAPARPTRLSGDGDCLPPLGGRCSAYSRPVTTPIDRIDWTGRNMVFQVAGVDPDDPAAGPHCGQRAIDDAVTDVVPRDAVARGGLGDRQVLGRLARRSGLGGHGVPPHDLVGSDADSGAVGRTEVGWTRLMACSITPGTSSSSLANAGPALYSPIASPRLQCQLHEAIPRQKDA